MGPVFTVLLCFFEGSPGHPFHGSGQNFRRCCALGTGQPRHRTAKRSATVIGRVEAHAPVRFELHGAEAAIFQLWPSTSLVYMGSLDRIWVSAKLFTNIIVEQLTAGPDCFCSKSRASFDPRQRLKIE